MNAVAALPTPTIHTTCPQDIHDIELPQWLADCLQQWQTELEQGQDEATVPHCLICRAFCFAYDLHAQQRRKSGEPYIAHPVAVAGLLRDLGGDEAMIAAGFLHDVVEDTDISIEQIEALFGEETASLVEGVTKLSKFNFSSTTEHQAENFRRMFLAMAKDIRVIVVKLADRLHNMRTLDALSPEKQRRIARETKDIFAPLANRLGIWRFKWELEDLSFKYLEPDSYRKIQSLVVEKRGDRESRLETVKDMLRFRLRDEGIDHFELQGRPKHLYGIYYKMTSQNKAFEEIYDIAALRIIVESKGECYRALSVVHDVFKPIPGRFKDYIGLPKPNRYQSLHTTVLGLTSRPLEIQIRTEEMHHVAEYGIAAHWKYKESGGSENTTLSSTDEKFTWLRQLLDWQSDLKDAQEYVENLKQNLFDDDVYVFTPKGEVISLARGATPVDFAYRIHTEVGHHMKGARVNGQWLGVDTRLKNGDIVEIVTQKNSHPSLDWLNFVVTPSARHRIRQWFKRSRRDENILRGRELLEKELGKTGLEALLKSEPMQKTAERCNYQTVEDLLAGLGYGEITSNAVVNRLRENNVNNVKNSQPSQEVTLASSPQVHPTTPPATGKDNSPIAGIEGLLYHIAGCCHPLPGEPIMGVVTRGARGISIHRQGCHNLEQMDGDRLIPVRWNPNNNNHQTYPVDIVIEAIDRVGVLKDILSRLSDNHINVRNAEVKTHLGRPAIISLKIDIRDYQQLLGIMAKIKNMSDVMDLRRVISG
ncbi:MULTISPECIES: bifunctional (p)ppGpp synthetase/guanosine-3',5'-bis(diphosphate) 3'-pyrophosphohydrolase [unclassified Synechocystis]|uniref:RelA/SpoT family protein n=1 Tax=unclassified Synechocystis TaxID=2640012 RepID=UPI0004063861|nr:MULTISPECIES: RelA/SpoT family protein [unclassified Synechocystis]AIE75780.1 GTP pyrophosphokinase, (p)ppGpp synthetase II / Guanosine-3',5'-bis(diphosphate) 3'-pyrophosphohydrolase [Synechocystis sp. PCC 6714]MCT0255284.1 RelA/SpoT family protein [Synechocystis sp. CS-94]